jgi:hypothetical protein
LRAHLYKTYTKVVVEAYGRHAHVWTNHGAALSHAAIKTLDRGLIADTKTTFPQQEADSNGVITRWAKKYGESAERLLLDIATRYPDILPVEK